MESILFGLALGDAIGWPVEFEQLPAIHRLYGPQGIQEPPNPAIYTDDTQLTLLIAEGILAAGIDAPVDAIMAEIGARFVDWNNDPATKATSPGGATQRGITRYEGGGSWRETGETDAKGCGSAMRVAALGYLYQHDIERLVELATAQSLMTHRHPAAIAGSIAAAHAVKLALDGIEPSSFIPAILELTAGMSDDLDRALLRVGHVIGWTDTAAALVHIGEGWVAEEAVALALYVVLKHPDDYVAAMRLGAHTNGDSDSIACIAGGILGARLGLSAIPAEWIARCQNADHIRDLAARLVTARG